MNAPMRLVVALRRTARAKRFTRRKTGAGFERGQRRSMRAA